MTVLISYVTTEEGYAALTAAIEEAQLRKLPIAVVNIVMDSDYTQVTVADEIDLDGVTNRLTELGLEFQIIQSIGTVSVASEVLRVASELPASMIVVGLHRRSLVGKALLGSNAQRIVVGAECPVLAVRPAVD